MAQTDLPPLADNSSEQPQFSSLAFLILPGGPQIKLNDTTKASEFHPVPIPGKGEPKGMAFPQNRNPNWPVTYSAASWIRSPRGAYHLVLTNWMS